MSWFFLTLNGFFFVCVTFIKIKRVSYQGWRRSNQNYFVSSLEFNTSLFNIIDNRNLLSELNETLFLPSPAAMFGFYWLNMLNLTDRSFMH